MYIYIHNIFRKNIRHIFKATAGIKKKEAHMHACPGEPQKEEKNNPKQHSLEIQRGL